MLTDIRIWLIFCIGSCSRWPNLLDSTLFVLLVWLKVSFVKLIVLLSDKPTLLSQINVTDISRMVLFIISWPSILLLCLTTSINILLIYFVFLITSRCPGSDSRLRSLPLAYLVIRRYLMMHLSPLSPKHKKLIEFYIYCLLFIDDKNFILRFKEGKKLQHQANW